MPRSQPPALLEIIVTSVADALAAQRGGADRLEVVSAMEHDGLTPDVDLVSQLLESVGVPLRVMLRSRPNFGVDEAERERLCEVAGRVAAAGANAFVFGFLTSDRRLDLDALRAVQEAAAATAWTLHRAFDHVAAPEAAFGECARLPALDLILTSGHPDGLDAGLPFLAERAGWQTPRVRFVAGGGLRADHVQPLLDAGITQLHAGRAVRRGHTWHGPVDEALVRQLKDAVLACAPRSSRGE